MKKQFFYYFFLAFFALTSCKKETCTIENAVGTPTEMVTGTWSIGYVTEKTIDANGKVLSSTTTHNNTGFTSLRSNGTYVTMTSNGTWQLSSDGKRVIYDKGLADERYYTILKLNYLTCVSEGPYRLATDKPYFSNKLYEYEGIK